TSLAANIRAPPQWRLNSPCGVLITITCVSHTALLKRAPALSAVTIAAASPISPLSVDIETTPGNRPCPNIEGREQRRSCREQEEAMPGVGHHLQLNAGAAWKGTRHILGGPNEVVIAHADEHGHVNARSFRRDVARQ